MPNKATVPILDSNQLKTPNLSAIVFVVISVQYMFGYSPSFFRD